MLTPEQNPSEFNQRTPELDDPEKIQAPLPPASEAAGATATKVFVAPTTPLEKKVAEIWATALGLEQVGLHDDFFELGGHSLLATQILAEVSRTFEVEMPLELVFSGELTVAALVKVIAELQLKQADQQELEAMLNQLSALSEDQVRQFLADKAAGS